MSGRSTPIILGRKRYASLSQYHLLQMPVVIPTFENPTHTQNMVKQLRERGLYNIIVMDNCSESTAMLDVLDGLRSEVIVIDLPQNLGPHHIFNCPETLSCLPDVFCMTDPDLELNPNMPDNFLQQMLFVSSEMQAGKVGLALRIDDHQDFLPTKITMGGQSYSILEWECRFWQDCVGHIADGSLVYRADIDTTFALYNKKFFDVHEIYKGFRIAGEYTCRHLPWYRSMHLPEQELETYHSRQKHSFYMRAS